MRWAQIKIQEIPLNTTENCEHSQTLEQIAQKGCGVSIIARVQNLTTHGQGSWTSWSPEVPSNSSFSVNKATTASPTACQPAWPWGAHLEAHHRDNTLPFSLCSLHLTVVWFMLSLLLYDNCNLSRAHRDMLFLAYPYHILLQSFSSSHCF